MAVLTEMMNRLIRQQAARQGHETAYIINDDVAAFMIKAQLSEAEKIARDWQPK